MWCLGQGRSHGQSAVLASVCSKPDPIHPTPSPEVWLWGKEWIFVLQKSCCHSRHLPGASETVQRRESESLEERGLDPGARHQVGQLSGLQHHQGPGVHVSLADLLVLCPSPAQKGCYCSGHYLRTHVGCRKLFLKTLFFFLFLKSQKVSQEFPRRYSWFCHHLESCYDRHPKPAGRGEGLLLV